MPVAPGGLPPAHIAYQLSGPTPSVRRLDCPGAACLLCATFA